MSKLTNKEILDIETILNSGGSNRYAARKVLGKSSSEYIIRRYLKRGIISLDKNSKVSGPKMLVIDIETAPILAYVWALFKQNIGLNMIKEDWYMLSYSAKWVGSDEVVYSDKRDTYNDNHDLDMLKEVWKLLDEADIVIGQNSVRFDTKKLNARFILNGMDPPSRYRQVDTMLMAKRHFSFTSNKLEYMTDKICTKYKKLKHGKFAGFELWKQCLLGNLESWQEMEEYNIYDVLSTEELYFKLAPWYNNHPNINLYYDDDHNHCTCGSDDWTHNGYAFTNLSKFDRFRCNNCGKEQRGRTNLLSKRKRKSLTANVI